MKRLILFLFSPLIVLALVAGLVYHQVHDTSAVPVTNPATPSVHKTTPMIAAGGFDKTQFSTTDPSSIWVVVNKQHPLTPKTYVPADLENVGNGQYLRNSAAAALLDMFAGAKQAGLTLTAASGYRSYTTQVSVYNNEVSSYGQARADSESARPGYSEHQTGLAMDIGGGGCSIDDCFATTPEGKWAAANAYKYGFILRYSADNTAVTGYRAEAWHFRYVGVDLATEMHTKNITTLEQFFGIIGGVNY